MADEDVIAETPATKRKAGRPRKATAPAQTGVSEDMKALIAVLADAQAKAAEVQANAPKAQAEAFAKIQNPSNPVPSGVSVFNPRGDKLEDWQMPRLKCIIHAPWKIHPEYHGLDREEVELFNLLEAGEYRVTLTDDSTAKVEVLARKNEATGALEEMRIKTNWTEEHKGKYPSMRAMLREMIGAKAERVMTMKREVALIATGELSVSV